MQFSKELPGHCLLNSHLNRPFTLHVPHPISIDYDSIYQKIFPILKLDVLCMQFSKAHLLASHNYSKVRPMDNRLKLYEFSIVSSATLLLGIIWNWAMTVKGLLVKFLGPHQQTGQSSLSQKWSSGGIHRVPRQGGWLFPPLVTGAGRSPLRFLKF